MADDKSQNDIAWEQLFLQYPILDQVERFGRYEIDASQINQVREARLMAKHDQRESLPSIFRQHHLSILPISRGRYVIGPFDTHQRVPYDYDLEVEYRPLPTDLQTLDVTNLYSEAAAINCAHIAGMIDDVLGGVPTYLTVSGRMTTHTFDMTVKSSIDGQPPYNIMVDKAQCEVDGGFEGDTGFVLLEAKNLTMPDFLVRQLYYPYRLWKARLSKPVIPVLMTYSNDIFDFFVYEFADTVSYNSLNLKSHRRYTVVSQDITRADIDALIARLRRVPDSVTFPQANDFNRVVDTLTILHTRQSLTRDQITEEYGYDPRQTNYYTDAARFLGLVDKSTDDATGDIIFELSEAGRALMSQQPRMRYLGLIERILQHEIFYQSFLLSLQRGTIPDSRAIAQVMLDQGSSLNPTTRERRASTVRSWLTWIWQRIAD